MQSLISNAKRYKRIPSEGEQDIDCEESIPVWQPLQPNFNTRLWIMHAAIVILSMTIGVFIGRSWGDCHAQKEVTLPQACIQPQIPPMLSSPERPDTFSSFEMPVFHGDYEPSEVRFSGSVKSKSPFKGPPSPSVDAAWDSLWAVNMVVSGDEYHASRPQFPQVGVKATNREDDAYFATFEATHQLHCLYTLFRASYVDYYEPERQFLLHDPDRYHERLDHCTDMLRQKLMCDSDSGIVTYVWVRGEDGPVADYSALHKCRNHDRLLAWATEHAATGVKFNKTMSGSVLEEEP